MEYFTIIASLVAIIVALVTFILMVRGIQGGLNINIVHRYEYPQPPEPAQPKPLSVNLSQEELDAILKEEAKKNPPIQDVIAAINQFMNGGVTNGN